MWQEDKKEEEILRKNFIEIAKNLINLKMDINDIVTATRFSKEEVIGLKNIK